MNSFLTYVKTYESLIELLLTVITISLSLFAIFQTHRLSKRQLEQEKRIAEQQEKLQIKQIEISLYERKNEISKNLNTVFDTSRMILSFLNNDLVDSVTREYMYDILKKIFEDVETDNISYLLKQSTFFFDQETALNIRNVSTSFASLSIYVDSLGLLTNLSDEDYRRMIVHIKKVCNDIESLQLPLEQAVSEEMEKMKI